MSDEQEADDTSGVPNLIGYLDSDGSWVTIAELEAKAGPELEASPRELIEELAGIDMMNVRRNEAGEPVAAQLSEFAVDLYRLPEDAKTGEVIGVYRRHGIEVPDELKEEWLAEIHDFDTEETA